MLTKVFLVDVVHQIDIVQLQFIISIGHKSVGLVDARLLERHIVGAEVGRGQLRLGEEERRRQFDAPAAGGGRLQFGLLGGAAARFQRQRPRLDGWLGRATLQLFGGWLRDGRRRHSRHLLVGAVLHLLLLLLEQLLQEAGRRRRFRGQRWAHFGRSAVRAAHGGRRLRGAQWR